MRGAEGVSGQEQRMADPSESNPSGEPRGAAGPSRPTRAADEVRLAQLLDEALACRGAARAAYLETLAMREPTLAARLRDLVSVLPDPELVGDDGTPLEFPRGDEGDSAAGSDSDEPAVGETVAGCVIRGVLGRGGTGTVYAADQLHPPRSVALKVLRLSAAGGSALRRFRNEAVALARLEHRGIARIYASGIAERRGASLPYIVMERIEGARSFVDWARDENASPRAIASKMAEACDAMQLGHQRGVLHRDLKPSNLLVDREGAPRVIDFGVARMLEREDRGESTVAGAIIGTPAYMAPEQFELPSGELDIRIDVHALGLILYEALCGRRAYDIQRHQYFDARRILRDTEPARADLVDSRIPRELASIVAKAMAKDRDRRYASMTEFRDDLVAFVEGRAVRAQPEDAVQRFARTVRRNPAWFLAAAVVFTVLLAATVVTTRQLRQAARSYSLAQAARVAGAVAVGNLTEARDLASKLPASFDPRIAAMLLNVVDQSAMESNAIPSGWNLMAGTLSPDRTRWLAVGDGGHYGLVDTRDMRSRAGRVEELGEFPWACAFTPDGTRAFLAGDGVLFEVPGGAAIDGPPAQPGEKKFISRGGWMQPRGMHISAGPDAWASFFSAGVGYAWAPLDGSPSQIADLGQRGRLVASAAWTDDRHGYFAQGNGRVVRFELDESGRTPRVDPSFVAPDEAVQSVAVARDGTRVALGLASGGLRIIDAKSSAVLGRGEYQHALWSVAFADEGDRVFAGDRSGRLHVIDLDSDGAVVRSRAQTVGLGSVVWALGVLNRDEVIANVGGSVTRIDASPRWSVEAASFGAEPASITDFDGRRMRAVATDGAVRELDMAEGRWRELPHGAPRAGTRHAIARDGRSLASIVDGIVRVVDLESGAASDSEPFAVGTRALLEWSDDGSMVAAVSTSEALLLDREGRTLARATIGAANDLIGLCWHARDQFVAVEPFETPRRIAFRYRKGALTFEREPVASTLGAIRSQGRWIVPQLGGDILISWPGGADLLEGDVEHYQLRLRGHDDYASAGDISPDRKWIATGGADGRIRLWSAEDGEPVFSLPLHESRIRWIRWSNDGKSLLSMDLRGDVRVLDSVSRAERVRSAPRGSGGEMLGKPVEADAAAAK